MKHIDWIQVCVIGCGISLHEKASGFPARPRFFGNKRPGSEQLTFDSVSRVLSIRESAGMTSKSVTAAAVIPGTFRSLYLFPYQSQVFEHLFPGVEFIGHILCKNTGEGRKIARFCIREKRKWELL